MAAFHEMLTPNGAFGEYGVAPENTTIHLPNNVSFEEGATIPLAAMTAALGLYQRLKLPLPWLPAQERLPLVVYSASSAVGAFAVKLAALSNIHPIIAVAGRGTAYVETLLDKSQGDVIIDYRQGNDHVVKELEIILTGEKLLYAFDAVSDKGSFQNLMKVMDHEKGRIALVLARKRYEGIPDTFQKFFTQVVSLIPFCISIYSAGLSLVGIQNPHMMCVLNQAHWKGADCLSYYRAKYMATTIPD